MNTKQRTRMIVYTALCIAIGVTLPLAFHAIPNAGSIFLPMHIPVLLCGLICGAPWGLACGILTPLISSMLTGMPPFAYLPGMLCELAAYGLMSGLLSRFFKNKNTVAGIYITLIAAMIAGRFVGGVLNALIFRFGSYSLAAWLSGYFITAFPGILIQLVLLPALVFALIKAGLVENRYAKTAESGAR